MENQNTEPQTKSKPDHDVYRGYWVLPGTKVPYLSKDSRGKLTPEEIEMEQSKLAAMTPVELEEIWRDGLWLGRTKHEKTRFDYPQLLKRLHERKFYADPIKYALSHEERMFLLQSINARDYWDQPEVLLSLVTSVGADIAKLPNEKMGPISECILMKTPQEKLNHFIDSVEEWFCDSEIVLRVAIKRPEIEDALLHQFTKIFSECEADNLPLAMLKAVEGNSLHPNFNPEVFSEILPMMLDACSVEQNLGAVEHAYKLAVLFNSVGQATDYIDKWARNSDSKQPVHDALLWALPESTNYNAKTWAKLALKHGPEALHYFANAESIERLSENEGSLGDYSVNQLKIVSQKQEYENYSENPEWGHLCAQLGMRNSVFERGVEIFKSIKAKDETPDIGIIDGASIGKPGFYMAKLPPSDPRNLLIGEMVDCCNHINGGETSDMAKAHVTSPYGACYVVFKETKKGKQNPKIDMPVAKLSGWISRRNNFVFNSWERLRGYEHLCEPFVKKAGEIILAADEKIHCVTLGRNRDAVAAFAHVLYSEIAKDPMTASYDSSTQYLVAGDPQARGEELDKEHDGDATLGNNEPPVLLPPIDKDFWELLDADAVSLGLIPPQITRLHAQLEPLKPKINDAVEELKSFRNEVYQNPRSGAQRVVGRDILRKLESAIKSSHNFKTDYSFQQGEMAAYLYNLCCHQCFDGLVPDDFDIKYFRSGYQQSIDVSDGRNRIMNYGGDISVKEWVKHKPKKAVTSLAIALALGGTGLKGCENVIKSHHEVEAHTSQLVSEEAHNPRIFYKMDTFMDWSEQFQGQDITNLAFMRKTYGATIEINGLKIPTELFVEKVAPSLNTLEEISKKDEPGRWSAAYANSPAPLHAAR